MNLTELLAVISCFIGLLAGVVTGAHYAWWWAVLGAPLGALAGLGLSIAIMQVVFSFVFRKQKRKRCADEQAKP
jgi:hypothetical protein